MCAQRWRTSAELLSKPTDAWLTPGRPLSLLSMADEHEEQVMPPRAICASVQELKLVAGTMQPARVIW
jgi:hypothetical protein